MANFPCLTDPLPSLDDILDRIDDKDKADPGFIEWVALAPQLAPTQKLAWHEGGPKGLGHLWDSRGQRVLRPVTRLRFTISGCQYVV